MSSESFSDTIKPETWNSDIEPATEQEEKDFEEYLKKVEEEEKIVDTFAKATKQKEIEVKKGEIKRFKERLSMRIMQMGCQDYDYYDDLGLNIQFYKSLQKDLRSNELFDGDIEKQYRLLYLFFSDESAITEPEEIREKVEEEFKGLT